MEPSVPQSFHYGFSQLRYCHECLGASSRYQLERRAISRLGVCQIPKTLHDRERSGNLCAKEGPNVD